MLRSTKDLENFSIGATDGPIGKVKDFYFDDEAWVARYIVVETGNWLDNRRVLVSPRALGTPNLEDGTLPASITRAQVRDSPDIDTHKPISRVNEERYATYYGYANYWSGNGLLGVDMTPGLMMPAYGGFGPGLPNVIDEPAPVPGTPDAAQPPGKEEDRHLRSSSSVTGYHVHAVDGDIGHVDGMLIDPHTWAIRFLVIATSNWWVGQRVIVATRLVDDISWEDGKVSVRLTREAIKASHVYDKSEAEVGDSDSRIYGDD